MECRRLHILWTTSKASVSSLFQLAQYIEYYTEVIQFQKITIEFGKKTREILGTLFIFPDDSNLDLFLAGNFKPFLKIYKKIDTLREWIQTIFYDRN